MAADAKIPPSFAACPWAGAGRAGPASSWPSRWSGALFIGWLARPTAARPSVCNVSRSHTGGGRVALTKMRLPRRGPSGYTDGCRAASKEALALPPRLQSVALALPPRTSRAPEKNTARRKEGGRRAGGALAPRTFVFRVSGSYTDGGGSFSQDVAIALTPRTFVPKASRCYTDGGRAASRTWLSP